MENEKTTKVSSNIAIIHVLAALIQNPLLFTDDTYKFTIDDFPEQFHRILFGAVEYLARNGMEKIGYIDIDQFLKQYPVQYKVFCANRGVEYIQNAVALYDPGKFDYYYNTLKKYSLINALQADGIDTKDIYDPDILDPVKCAVMCEAFDNMSVNDILLKEETKIILAKERFGSNSDRVENKMGDAIDELIEQLKETPEMGLPLMSPKLTTIYRGMRKGCVFMTSAGQGSGKTRLMVGDAVHLAIPEYYDNEAAAWVSTGFNEKVLLLETELELREVQTMALAAISGVPENKILDGRYSGNEEERVLKAARLIKSSNFYLVAITNYDTDDLINTIKKYHQLYGVEYVFYDYLSENVKILAEGTRKTKVQGLRTDQILLIMITALKDCAKQLGIFIATSTQLSGDFKNAKELDASYLRAAKSLSDKVDVGAILTPVREMDQPVIESYCAKGFETVPNFVISVYKIRRGTYQNIKVYVHFDRGTCRLTDAFVTDSKGVLLPVEDTTVELILDKTEEHDFDKAYAPTTASTQEEDAADAESQQQTQDEAPFDFDF